LRPLGYRVPLAFERGYHREFKPNPARPLRRPIYDIDGSFIMTPMEQGIRVTSGVELTGRDAPSSFAQLDQVVPLARSVAEFGDAVGETWRGSRPTLPDGLPMIGVAPRHAGLWLAFGNQHIGFTTGPATGAAIAAMIDGAPSSYDVTPFSKNELGPFGKATRGRAPKHARSCAADPDAEFGPGMAMFLNQGGGRDCILRWHTHCNHRNRPVRGGKSLQSSLAWGDSLVTLVIASPTRKCACAPVGAGVL
jgi:hypothetical protein